MFRAKTLLVLGAGASLEVGLPIGSDLLGQISESLDFRFDAFGRPEKGDPQILTALKVLLNEGGAVALLNEHLKAGRQLRKSSQQALSIDNVIDALEDEKVELIGKLGILRAILQAEASSRYFQPPEEYREGIQIDRFRETWYGSLTKLLTENVKRSEIGGLFNNLEIINFNYDRCLEHYLPFSLSEYYGVSPDEIRGAMQGLKVHRPYGLCGKLPWMKSDGTSVAFGEGSAEKLSAVVERIRTFTEQLEDGEELQAIKGAVSQADRIVFLGFAFHRQNIRVLAAPIKDHTEIVATAVGISSSDQDVIEDELAKAFEFDDPMNPQLRVTLAELTCNEFFKGYWRTLTADSPE